MEGQVGLRKYAKVSVLVLHNVIENLDNLRYYTDVEHRLAYRGEAHFFRQN